MVTRLEHRQQDLNSTRPAACRRSELALDRRKEDRAPLDRKGVTAVSENDGTRTMLYPTGSWLEARPPDAFGPRADDAAAVLVAKRWRL